MLRREFLKGVIGLCPMPFLVSGPGGLESPPSDGAVLRLGPSDMPPLDIVLYPDGSLRAWIGDEELQRRPDGEWTIFSGRYGSGARVRMAGRYAFDLDWFAIARPYGGVERWGFC